MDPGLRDLLEYQTLSAAYDAQEQPNDYFFTTRFFTNPDQVDTDNYKIVFYPKMRRPAPMNTPGAEARVLTTGKGTEREAVLFSQFNAVDLPTIVYQALREPDSYELQKMGRTSLTRILSEFRTRHLIAKEVTFAQIMTFGRVNIGKGGDFLTPTVNSTSGALTDAANTEFSCDFGVSNNNRGNLDGLITQLWSDPNAKIGDQLDTIRNDAEKQGTKPPTKIKAHTLARRWLRGNYQFQDWAVRNNVAQDSILQGEIFPGLWGFDWEFFGGKYESNNTNDSTANTTVDYIPTTQVIIHPDEGPWLKAASGLTWVPKTVGVVTDLDEALANQAAMYGTYSYAKVCDNPNKLQLFMGDTFGLNFPDPRPIYMPTVFSS